MTDSAPGWHGDPDSPTAHRMAKASQHLIDIHHAPGDLAKVHQHIAARDYAGLKHYVSQPPGKGEFRPRHDTVKFAWNHAEMVVKNPKNFGLPENHFEQEFSEASAHVTADHRAILKAIMECSKQHPHLIRLKDVAKRVQREEHEVAQVCETLHRGGLIKYNLTTGYTLEPLGEKLAMEAAPVVEDGGIGGRAVGARTMFPVSYQTLSDLSAKRTEKLMRADEVRERTRSRLRELAQEQLVRRPLSIDGRPG